MKDTQEALDKMKGAVMIVYPMGLPPHDTVRLELENNEDLSGTQVSLHYNALVMQVVWDETICDEAACHAWQQILSS